MNFPSSKDVRTAIDLADAAGRLAVAFTDGGGEARNSLGVVSTISKMLALSREALTVEEPAKAEAIELVVTHSAESAATDEQALEEELARGQVAAVAIVRHALGMGANKCSIPVKLDGGSTYLVSVSSAERTPEEDFEHFLAYSGLHHCSKGMKDLMLKAFLAGK